MDIKNSFRVVGLVMFLVISASVFPAWHQIAYAQTSTQTPPYTRYQVAQATNKARLAKDLDVLNINSALSRAAQRKATDMVQSGYFGHVAPTGTKYWDFITDAGYTYKSAGENLAFQYGSAQALLKAWLKSSGHRANILGTQYTDIGVGMAYGERNGEKGWYVVEMFGSKHYNPIFSMR